MVQDFSSANALCARCYVQDINYVEKNFQVVKCVNAGHIQQKSNREHILCDNDKAKISKIPKSV